MPHPDGATNDGGRRNRLCRQNRDDASGRRVATRPAGTFEPRLLDLGDIGGELERETRRPFQCRCERGSPGRDAALAEPDNALDVRIRVCREDDRHRRHKGGSDAATAEASSFPPIQTRGSESAYMPQHRSGAAGARSTRRQTPSAAPLECELRPVGGLPAVRL